MMKKDKVLRYVKFAKERNKELKIITSKQKEMKVNICDYRDGLVEYKFLNSEILSFIKIENIDSVDFINYEDKNEFSYHNLNVKYNTSDIKNIIKSFQNYYLEIIDVLLSNENEEDSKGYYNLENKKRTYPKIFKNLIHDENNLLFYYFTKEKPSSKLINNQSCEKEVLLIEQANLSQKKALDNAIKERISIIEGPPGTGTTTTILNILANLIFQKKKVLVVSKNNSAIENIVEEFSEMDIPRCYIRMRKFKGYNAKKS